MGEPSRSDEPSRARYASGGIPGPHPCDADSLDLALFAVGWELMLRDLRIGLSSEEHVAAVLSVLDKHQVHSAFAIRNNVVNYKKVLLGVYRNGVTLSHDLRRLAAFFREPPLDLDESHRGFFRPSRYRELSDALCTTDGAVGGVLDARRFCKAVCCVPRHPDASRSLPRPFGQPFAHYRCAGLLSEALPQAMKGWRLLQECKTACDALGASSEGKEGDGESGEGGDGGDGVEGGGLGQRLNAILRASGKTFAALPEEAPSGWDALLESLRSLCLPSDEEWFVRCALIARGGMCTSMLSEIFLAAVCTANVFAHTTWTLRWRCLQGLLVGMSFVWRGKATVTRMLTQGMWCSRYSNRSTPVLNALRRYT